MVNLLRADCHGENHCIEIQYAGQLTVICYSSLKGGKNSMKIFSISWWIGMLINTFITIMFIYILKVIFSKVNVPIVSNMVEQA